MKFHVNRDVFSEAVSFVVKLLPQRNPQPILAGRADRGIRRGTVARGLRLRGIRAHHDRGDRRRAGHDPRPRPPAVRDREPPSERADPDRGRRRRRHRPQLRLGTIHPLVHAGAGVPRDPRGLRRLRARPGRGLRDRDRPGRVRGLPRRRDSGAHRRAARGDGHDPEPRRHRPLPRRAARHPVGRRRRPARNRPRRSFPRAPSPRSARPSRTAATSRSRSRDRAIARSSRSRPATRP